MSTYPLRRPPARRRSSTVVLIVIAVVLALSACATDEDEVASDVDQGEAIAVADTPDWIEKIYPPPGSETSAAQAVQVVHTAIEADRQVRLSINGTDVTTYALGSEPGLLVYEMDDPDAPVQLRPGDHTAEVLLMRRTPGEGEGTESYDSDVHEAIDTYSWDFTVL